MSAAAGIRAGAPVQGTRICMQHVYEWQEDGAGVMTVSEADPYYCGGWSVTVADGDASGEVIVEGGMTPYGLSHVLTVDMARRVVTLAVGETPFATVTGGATTVAGGVTTRVDSVSRYYVVNEEWLTGSANLANVTGVILNDGSIHIAAGFAYYIETSVTTTITGKDGTSRSYTDETVSTSPIYRDTWLLVANGKHEFVNEADGTQSIVDVNIRQSGDTVWVTNLYGYGAPQVYMVLDSVGAMTFDSQMVRDIPASMSPSGNGMWQNSAVTGTVTHEAITWGLTTPTDGAQTWPGWNTNRLYYTDGSQFVIPGEVQGLRGDVNLDHVVNISDVTALINCLLNNNWEDCSFENADCDQDGDAKISDVTALINYLLNGSWTDE